MPEADPLSEANRVLRICAACMYCDGLCPVFPALAGKHAFSRADIGYLAHLCHNCRACWNDCQYAPPHEFAVDLPTTLAQARQLSFADHLWPRGLPPAFGLLAMLAVGGGLALAPATAAPGFYGVVSWHLMAGLAGAATLWALVAAAAAVRSYAREIAPANPSWRAAARAAADIVTLRHLGGGGAGCYEGDEAGSQRRRLAHQVLVGGVLLDLLSTLSAAVYQDALGLAPPYAWTSLPVVLGASGGVAILAGAGALLALKRGARVEPREHRRNLALLAGLIAIAASGLLLLAGRDSAAMPALLKLHLALVVGGLIAIPASKLLHAPFRALALYRAAADRLAQPLRMRPGGRDSP